eukprot:CAMPEP_0206423988 /NCGR_PEP_ID=MMETSP0324_2-20121206/2975_1 /ASSEMBLY_ACC=CAM_ASM_000836 /TAXON_ID=2866 /ORGANISM="Crypthecodinium cohnii, Strain Seligo" /LENGTH=603 /DNA_ID=CAMNT_0053888587 /DNA_START=308 /DNA_END=2121 /DNA_ORIENTATION=+
MVGRFLQGPRGFMTARTMVAVCWLLLAEPFWSYDKVHMVNLYEVVCPDGAGYFDVELDEDELNTLKYNPHVVTFLRTGGRAVNITFTVLNNASTPWSLGSQSLVLVDVGETGITTTTTVTTTLAASNVRRLEELGVLDNKDEGFLDRALDKVMARITDNQVSDLWKAPARILRAASRRRGTTTGTDAPRRRSYTASPPRRRSYYSSPPRRRSYTDTDSSPPRRRTYYYYTPPPRRRNMLDLDHRRREPPRRRSTYREPRRRGSSINALSAPYYSAAGNRWSSPATGGTCYGYTSASVWSSTYTHSVSTTSYGYTGASAYRYSAKTMVLAAAAGFAGGAVVTASTYYLYRSLTSSSCSSYSCCFGCSNSCYSSTNSQCTITVNDLQTQDDIMESGFFPDELAPFPLRVRVTSIDGEDYTEANVCPPSSCTDYASCESSGGTTNSLWVTLTKLEELAEEGSNIAGAHMGTEPLFGLLVALSFFSGAFTAAAATCCNALEAWAKACCTALLPPKPSCFRNGVSHLIDDDLAFLCLNISEMSHFFRASAGFSEPLEASNKPGMLLLNNTFGDSESCAGGKLGRALGRALRQPKARTAFLLCSLEGRL